MVKGGTQVRGDTDNYPMSHLMCVLYAFVVIVLAAAFLLWRFFCSFAHVRKVERKLSTNSLTVGACDPQTPL
jgi:hypothetical protein